MKQVKHWQGPANALLGAWFALSPWVLRYQDQMTPTANGVVVGVLLIAAALGATLVPRAWEEWTEGALGLWMIASPWVLGFDMHMDALRNATVTGIAVLGLALWVLASDKDYSTWWHHRSAH